MNQTLSRLLAPRFGLYFWIMIVFAAITALLGKVEVALGQAAVVLVLYLVYLRASMQRRREAARYLDQLLGSVDEATRDSTLNCPLPVVMFRPDTEEIVWSNDRFLHLSGDRERLFDTKLTELVPQFDSRWLLEGKHECPYEVPLGRRRYQVFGNVGRTQEEGRESLLATTYWLDVTEASNLKEIYQATRPVVAILLLDNYEDTIKGLPENVASNMMADINQRISQWMGDVGGIFCRLDRDRFLYIFEEQYLQKYKEEKFSILDSIRQVQTPSGISVTLSLGLGVDGETPADLYRFASLSVEMALSRGGDQAVVKNRFNFEFFGGRAKETEKRTKVKSRVMASALGELVADASCVFVMGHAAADMDAVGAAVGVCAIARKKGVPYYIVRESNPTPADQLYRRLEWMDEYKDRFVDSQQALLKADSRSLLVVVDTNRPEQVASREVLQSCNKVAVIDHHRRAATYIEGGALYFHEPYASSTCELVSELLSYLMEPGELLRGEAEAMMAGLMLDTKNFTMRTGGRTFEAAAFLRRAGGDTGEVKKMFQTDLADTVAKYGIIQNAKMYRHDIAIAPVHHTVNRVTAAQAADELLNIAGINTSFVLYPDGERVVVSARSINDTNVQVILEALGGGGNAGAAGAQIAGQTLEQVAESLMATLERYFKTDDPEEMGEEEE